MNQIVVATAIRDEKAYQAYMNSLVSMEIKRQQARMRAEKELARTEQARRNRMLEEKLQAMERRYTRRPSPIKRIIDKVENAWCMAWAVWFNAGEIFINWCILKGFLVKER